MNPEERQRWQQEIRDELRDPVKRNRKTIRRLRKTCSDLQICVESMMM